MNPVGEPDAGNRHVRFDERGWETEPQATAPNLDSTEGSERASFEVAFEGSQGATVAERRRE
jgi:hypothetical protein